MEVERWAKSTAGPDWTISLGWGTFSTVVSSFLATPKTILEPSHVVHPRLEPFHRGKNIFTVEQGGGTVERSIRYCTFTRCRYCFVRFGIRADKRPLRLLHCCSPGPRSGHVFKKKLCNSIFRLFEEYES